MDGKGPPPYHEGGFPAKQIRRCEGFEKKETTETDLDVPSRSTNSMKSPNFNNLNKRRDKYDNQS